MKNLKSKKIQCRSKSTYSPLKNDNEDASLL